MGRYLRWTRTKGESLCCTHCGSTDRQGVAFGPYLQNDQYRTVVLKLWKLSGINLCRSYFQFHLFHTYCIVEVLFLFCFSEYDRGKIKNFFILLSKYWRAHAGAGFVRQCTVQTALQVGCRKNVRYTRAQNNRKELGPREGLPEQPNKRDMPTAAPRHCSSNCILTIIKIFFFLFLLAAGTSSFNYCSFEG